MKKALIALFISASSMLFAQDCRLEFLVRNDDGLAVWDENRTPLLDSAIVYCATNTIEPSQDKEIQFHPNPTDGEIVCSDPDVVVEVFNVLGHLVKRFQNRTEMFDLPQGTYFAKVNNKITKIIKL